VREGDEKVLYVDDLIVTGASLAAISAFKEEMCQRLKMSDLGVLCLYLGIEVSQQPGRITLKQSSFTTKLLEKAGMADCNRTHVPMEPRLKLSKKTKNPAVNAMVLKALRRPKARGGSEWTPRCLRRPFF
jgi:hypothetical protein